jgi:hypothetical protein
MKNGSSEPKLTPPKHYNIFITLLSVRRTAYRVSYQAEKINHPKAIRNKTPRNVKQHLSTVKRSYPIDFQLTITL